MYNLNTHHDVVRSFLLSLIMDSVSYCILNGIRDLTTIKFSVIGNINLFIALFTSPKQKYVFFTSQGSSEANIEDTTSHYFIK